MISRRVINLRVLLTSVIVFTARPLPSSEYDSHKNAKEDDDGVSAPNNSSDALAQTSARYSNAHSIFVLDPEGRLDLVVGIGPRRRRLIVNASRVKRLSAEWKAVVTGR